ncbi:MAG: YoaK family protein [Bdellovibrionales bacterium]
MLYGNESISHYTKSNISIWMTLAFQAGMLNIGGFMACHRFVSHVTGFATHIGFELSEFHYSQAIGMMSVPMFFLLGSMLSGLLVDLRLKLHKKPRYYFTFGVIFFMILTVLTGGTSGHFGVFGESLDLIRDYELLAILCLVCGIQNGTITTVSKSIIRTTHLTGITTDLGIGIIRVLNQHKIQGSHADEVYANLMRVGIIAFFLIGSIAGGFMFSNFGYKGFIAPAITSGLLFASTFYFQVIKKHEPRHL